MSINNISFLSTVLATLFVAGVCLYGAARSVQLGRFLAALAVLTLIPLWFAGQLLLLIIYEKLTHLGITSREYHLDYALTPVLNVAGAAFIGYVVINFVRRLAAARTQDEIVAPPDDAHEGELGRFFEPRKMAGLLCIALGAVSMSDFFIVSGVLLVIVGVSLMMNVRLWRS